MITLGDLEIISRRAVVSHKTLAADWTGWACGLVGLCNTACEPAPRAPRRPDGPLGQPHIYAHPSLTRRRIARIALALLPLSVNSESVCYRRKNTLAENTPSRRGHRSGTNRLSHVGMSYRLGRDVYIGPQCPPTTHPSTGLYTMTKSATEFLKVEGKNIVVDGKPIILKGAGLGGWSESFP